MKKLLLIGNGPIPIDISKKVDEFDYVFRINRMTNFETTGKRIDGLFIGVYRDFLEIYHGGKFKREFKNAKQIFLTQSLKRNFKNDWQDYLTQEQWDNVKLFSFRDNKEHIKAVQITTTIRILDILTSDPEWYENYEIWICGITVEGRGELMKYGAPWAKTSHSKYGYEEEMYLKKLLEDGKIKRLIPEIDDIIYNSKGEINTMP
jgi:hypothetical protein